MSYIDPNETHKALWNTFYNSAPAEKERARAQLCELNMPLVKNYIAVKYAGIASRPGRQLTCSDLMIEGSIGLLKAIDKYKPETGNKFSTYAMIWIHQSITQALVNYENAIRLPVDVFWKRFKNGQGPIPVDSLDEPYAFDSGETGDSFLECQPSDEDTETDGMNLYTSNYLHDSVRSALHVLDERQRLVIRLRFGLDGPAYALKDIAPMIGVSRERTRQISEQAFTKLRHELASIGRDFK